MRIIKPDSRLFDDFRYKSYSSKVFHCPEGKMTYTYEEKGNLCGPGDRSGLCGRQKDRNRVYCCPMCHKRRLWFKYHIFEKVHLTSVWTKLRLHKNYIYHLLLGGEFNFRQIIENSALLCCFFRGRKDLPIKIYNWRSYAEKSVQNHLSGDKKGDRYQNSSSHPFDSLESTETSLFFVFYRNLIGCIVSVSGKTQKQRNKQPAGSTGGTRRPSARAGFTHDHRLGQIFSVQSRHLVQWNIHQHSPEVHNKDSLRQVDGSPGLLLGKRNVYEDKE